ncbi:hypothetical protein PR048_020223 [Dryococelus australis]|uniref:Uncharacterized protein n=1 Tax=Dryococelus australis TaxID=614101 RepID=A0ABQ9H5P4_9NEOP|nr:hypothetical protein PR048_020223 [Dryococelus australis]
MSEMPADLQLPDNSSSFYTPAKLTFSDLIYTVQHHNGKNYSLARKSDEALGMRASAVRIAPSVLDLRRAAPIHNLNCLNICLKIIARVYDSNPRLPYQGNQRLSRTWDHGHDHLHPIWRLKCPIEPSWLMVRSDSKPGAHVCETEREREGAREEIVSALDDAVAPSPSDRAASHLIKATKRDESTHPRGARSSSLGCAVILRALEEKVNVTDNLKRKGQTENEHNNNGANESRRRPRYRESTTQPNHVNTVLYVIRNTGSATIHARKDPFPWLFSIRSAAGPELTVVGVRTSPWQRGFQATPSTPPAILPTLSPFQPNRLHKYIIAFHSERAESVMEIEHVYVRQIGRHDWRGRGGVVVRLLTSHLGEPGSLPDFHMWESCRRMPLVGVFSRRSPVCPILSFLRCSILISLHPHRLSRPRC